VSQPQVISFISSKTCAVNTGLLTGAKTGNHTVLSIADRVGLSVLESNGGDSQVSEGFLGEL
jgi:hypothetical protein